MITTSCIPSVRIAIERLFYSRTEMQDVCSIVILMVVAKTLVRGLRVAPRLSGPGETLQCRLTRQVLWTTVRTRLQCFETEAF